MQKKIKKPASSIFRIIITVFLVCILFVVAGIFHYFKVILPEKNNAKADDLSGCWDSYSEQKNKKI